jgi:hypothetical protein
LVETLQVHGALALKDKYTNLGLRPKCKVASIKYDDDGDETSILTDANYRAYLENTVLSKNPVSAPQANFLTISLHLRRRRRKFGFLPFRFSAAGYFFEYFP